jgi:hypothetical protein
MAAADELEAEAFYRRLPVYFGRLRLDGLTIDTEQESQLVLLLSRLESTGAMPKSAAALARLIVPILAGTSAQQAMCHDHFRAVFCDPQPVARRPHTRMAGEPQGRKTWLQGPIRVGVKRATTAFIVVAAIAIVAFAAHSIYGRRPLKLEVPPPPASTQPGEKQLPDWIRTIPLNEMELPQQRPWNRTLRWFYTEFGWQKSVVAALPWLIFAAAFGGLVYLTVARLRRDSLPQNLRSLPFSFQGDRPQFGDRSLIAELQSLRSLAKDEIREIDPEAMAVATAEQGGLLTPRWRFRPVPVDFVVMIDRRSPRDHLACYGEAMVETLRSSGLFVEHFDFDRTPWTCRRRRSGENETLYSVLNSFAGAVFLFFICESELLNPSSGAPKSWIAELKNAGRIFLVVPDQASAYPLDWVLPKYLSIVQATPSGLRALAAKLLARVPAPLEAVRTPASPLISLVARVNARADRWMQSAAPPKSDIDGLVSELEEAAGAKDFRWIAATAVYPELRWPMTLCLRDRVGGRIGQPAMLGSDILEAAQLPWFRRGWMPEWMRTRLMAKLTISERRQVRSILLRAMGIKASQLTETPMEVSALGRATEPANERVRADRILVNYLFTSLTSASRFFALPEEWAKKIARRPLGGLAIAGVCGALFTAAGSFVGLALLPIDECDLWGTSPLKLIQLGRRPGHIEW